MGCVLFHCCYQDFKIYTYFTKGYFYSLQYTMVNPVVVGSSVLFTFIEIMETICEKALKKALKSNGC